MQHQVKVTVLDKKVYPELQAKYCKNPQAGVCPYFQVGDVFLFTTDGEGKFMHMGQKTKQNADQDGLGNQKPFCSEAWDAISRYIYAGLQGGTIMKGWMQKDNEMIACCNDGTRPVIFKIERIDIPD